MRIPLRDERGGILVMAAVMIPVFLLLTALVVDVGNWYTHKRQLQNRADAGAFAAGVEYARNWKACVQTGDAALRATTGAAIADAARQYAGDPEASDYAGGTLPSTLRNTEITNQANLDVVINSNDPDYTDDTDYSDGGGSPPQGNPCYLHPTGDDISAGGQWTDVRVKERDLPSLFGSIGLPLSRNGARARIEIRPALSGNQFLPLAVPNNIITKVQVRYYDECRDPSRTGTPLAKYDLAELPGTVTGVGSLWGIPTGGTGDPNTGFTVTLPSYGGCSQAYLPIGVQVRIASRDEIDLDANTCGALLAMQYADCFSRLSQIRVWNDGDPDNQVRIGDVHLTGGCANNGSPDTYFDTLPVAATDCRYGANLYVNWGGRDDGNKNVPANFTVTVNGAAAALQGSLSGQAGGYSLYTVASNVLTANPGANNVTVALNWVDTNNTHSYQGQNCRNGGSNPCRYSASEPVHRAFVGTPGNAGAVAFVRTSMSQWTGNPAQPGSAYANQATGGNTVTLFPTIGIRTALRTGVYTTLRVRDSQENNTVQCDPSFSQEFDMFLNGCQPWFGENHFNGDVLGAPNNTASWWNTSTRTCPRWQDWYSTGDAGAGFGANSMNNPWRCLVTSGGTSTGQVGDWIAVATDNCDNIQSNSCQIQSFDCNYNGDYDNWVRTGGVGDATGGNPVQVGSAYPRVVNLFIVPYQARKGVTGRNEIPVLGFASFYVMDWGGSNSNQDDPCPDRTYDPDGSGPAPAVTMPRPADGAIAGIFVETVKYEPGPVDATAVCVEDQLTPCRVTLVR